MVKEKSKKIKKAWIILAAVAAAVAGYAIWSNLAVINAARPYMIDEKNAMNFNAQCILVLGAQINGGEPSQVLKNRLDEGIRLYEQGCAPRILLTGDGGGNGQDEISAMKKYVLDAGVREEDVFVDREGFDTYDSMYRAKMVFGVKQVLVVTQTFHLSRAVYIARSLGIEAAGVAAQPVEDMQFLRDIREVGARGKDFLTSYFKPELQMNGLPVLIGGDGRVTK